MAFAPIKYIREHVLELIPRDVSANQVKWGAILWGDALILFGAWLAWDRLSDGAPQVGTLPYVLAAIGLLLRWLMLIPPLGKRIYIGILMLVAPVAFILSTILMTVFFYAMVTPMGFCLRLSGKDFLQLRRSNPPGWKPHPDRRDRRRYYRLF